MQVMHVLHGCVRLPVMKTRLGPCPVPIWTRTSIRIDELQHVHDVHINVQIWAHGVARSLLVILLEHLLARVPILIQ